MENGFWLQNEKCGKIQSLKIAEGHGKNQETLPEFQKVNRVGSIITVMHVFLGCNHQSYFLLTRDSKN